MAKEKQTTTKPPETASEKKKCFVISEIGDPKTDKRERSDRVFEFVIREALETVGNYDVSRADKLDDPGRITKQVVERICNADLVVADLTGLNPNVFYELALCHAFQTPLVQLIDDTKKLPFDIQDMRTIPFDFQDLQSVADAKASIVSQVTNIERDGFTMDTPLSQYLTFDKVKHSASPKDVTELTKLADIDSRLLRMARQLEQVLDETVRDRRPNKIRYPATQDETRSAQRAVISEFRELAMTLAETFPEQVAAGDFSGLDESFTRFWRNAPASTRQTMVAYGFISPRGVLTDTGKRELRVAINGLDK